MTIKHSEETQDWTTGMDYEATDTTRDWAEEQPGEKELTGVTSYTPEEYQEKKDAKLEHLQNKARKLRAESNNVYNSANKEASSIPFGQPILVGHHSEKRARNQRSRITNRYEKSFRLSEKANQAAEKIAIVRDNTAISTDDPEAILKLKEKLTHAELDHTMKKAANAYYRKHKTIDEGFLYYNELGGVLRMLEFALKWNNPTMYHTTNTNAKVKSIKERIARLERLADLAEKGNKEIEFEGGSLLVNYDINRIQFFFDSIPDVDIRTKLKGSGFKFSKYNNNAWQRQITGNANYAARVVLDYMKNKEN